MKCSWCPAEFGTHGELESHEAGHKVKKVSDAPLPTFSYSLMGAHRAAGRPRGIRRGRCGASAEARTSLSVHAVLLRQGWRVGRHLGG